jgi:hypothetical protein
MKLSTSVKLDRKRSEFSTCFKNRRQDIGLKDKIFIPEIYIYELLKFESPEVLKKSESLTMSSSSNVRCKTFYQLPPNTLVFQSYYFGI